jgi:hypothetical protein
MLSAAHQSPPPPPGVPAPPPKESCIRSISVLMRPHRLHVQTVSWFSASQLLRHWCLRNRHRNLRFIAATLAQLPRRLTPALILWPSPHRRKIPGWPVGVKGGRRPSRSDLPLTVASTAAGWPGSGRVGWGGRRRLRGGPPSGARIAPRACIRSIGIDRNHDAVIRIGGGAPGRRVHSAERRKGHVHHRITATSDRRGRPSGLPERVVLSSFRDAPALTRPGARRRLAASHPR